MSALLTSGQPAREPQLVRYAADRAVPVVNGAAADLQETLAVKPNLPGANVVLVGVFDTRRPSPGRAPGGPRVPPPGPGGRMRGQAIDGWSAGLRTRPARRSSPPSRW